MEKNYNHLQQEPLIYDQWVKNNVFSVHGLKEARIKSDIKSNGNSYTVLMPPPNANGALHCGHATYSIQDLMIRFKRMQGYDVEYLPGTDHAGFETQVVYERNLKKEGKTRFDFDRETFYNNVLNFVLENSDGAKNQLKKIGMSADWERSTFTLDPKVVDFVYDTFIRMYEDGMIYRDGYMVNYSSFFGTTFSDLETEYKESISPLYYVRYRFVDDSSKYLTVATVRPETIYADVAVAVNPKDERFKNLIGKLVINPLTNKEIPVIADEYVDMEFGTGALKITPGHDVNDFKIGKKNNLEIISLIDLDGKMNAFAGECAGMFPKQARVKTAEILKAKDALEKIDEKYENRVLVDYKDQLPIEPMILPNWFVNIDKLADLAIQAIETEEVRFNLPEWKRDTLRWIKDKKPWPISRQTVFGIRIPVWYNIKENPEMTATFISKLGENVTGKVTSLLEKYSIEEIRSGLQKIVTSERAAFKVSKTSPGEDYLPETDTFDTWFSSGQWPLVTMLNIDSYEGAKGKSYPENALERTNAKLAESELFGKYFPTDFLDSGYEIMFFWIARMIMFSKYLTKQIPFKDVYFHGMVTDKFGKKMSKSKGNVINPLEYIEKYGADALRMGIIVGGNTEARFTPLDEDKVRGYRNFANKIWNISRFIQLKGESIDLDPGKITNEDDKKILADLNALITISTSHLENFKFKFAGEAIYDFIWNNLANDYMEKIKDREDKEALSVLKHSFMQSLKLLHPFMPFITETVWSELGQKEMIIISEWPKASN